MPTIDLSQLPAIIESLDYEVILAQTKTFMISVFPEAMRDEVAAALELESEPLNIIAQAMAWRELLLRQRINDGAAACMLSHSSGSDLDNLGVNMNVQRLVITEAMESDAAFRMRIQSAFEGMSVAGPSGSYEYFARSASGKVADARATSPAPAEVVVALLSADGDGTANEALINEVKAVLNDETVRPVADRLTSATRLMRHSIFTRGRNQNPYFRPHGHNWRRGWQSSEELVVTLPVQPSWRPCMCPEFSGWS